MCVGSPRWSIRSGGRNGSAKRYRPGARHVILYKNMKRLVASLVTLVAVAACGAVSTPGGGGGSLTVSQLKFKVLDQVGPVAYCDPDFYPIARDGGEQTSAVAMFDKIQADAEVYGAILEHEHLPSGDLTDAQKLTLYRAYKTLHALTL